MKGMNRGNSADLLMMNGGSSAEIDGGVKLRIRDSKGMSDSYTSSASIFEPQTTFEKRESSAGNSSPPSSVIRAPEKKLTLFALRLAVLEKSATGLGALSFIWATVVLLGGFAIFIEKTDFWFITIILLVEGTRLFSRSHELQWQHQSTWSLTDAGRNSFRLLQSSSRFLTRAFKAIFHPVSAIGSKSQHKGQTEEVAPRSRPEDSDKRRKISRRWESSDVPLLPYASWVFSSKNIIKLFHWLQVVAAIACVVLSLIKLIKHNYGEVDKSEKKNRKSALIIFYSLALAEALLFLLEKAYWELKIIYGKLLEEVTKECGLEASAVVSVRRFFYDAYSRCLDGSIFDGLKMDMVSFSMDLLESDSHDEQLIGARILRTFATSERFSHDTLQKIGVTFSIMERLVEMLNWKGPQEEEIREAAGVIVAKLAGKKQNSLRVAGIPGAIESISSLLYTTRNSTAAFDEIGDRNLIFDHPHYGFWTFNHLGLKILKKLASDPGNCGKIGNTRGLLPKIIDFSHAEERLLKDKNAAASQIMTVKISLLVIKKLVSTAGTTGKQLRQEIGEIVFTISNIRDILRFGEKHPELQKLSVEILTSLAIDDDATERIGCTGGIIKELLNIFFKEGMPEEQNHVRIAAGEALTMLAMESNSNCKRILRLGAVKKLVSSLEVPFLCENAARILRNLCTYCGEECFIELRGVTAAVPTVLKGIMSADNKLQEVMVGLAAHAFKFLTPDESRIMFEKVGIQTTEIAKALVHILKKYPKPPIKIPRVRRYTIELTIWMMKENRTNASIFKNLGLQQELQNVLETTSELESFHIFSGAVGLNRFRTSIHSMVETALILMDDKLEDLGASH